MVEAMDAWIALHLELPEDAADPVANFLFEQGVTGLIEDTRFEPVSHMDGPRRMEAHIPAKDAAAIVASLRHYAAAIAALDASLGPVHIETKAVPPTDWEAVFRTHHHPLEVGARLLVAPPWNVPAAPGRVVIVIDPGMAFGTGQHPTTRTCLEEVEEAIGTGRVRSVLDVGTGTGILAAVAARLGVPRVVAVDIDPSTLPVAAATLERNAATHVRLAAGGPAAVRGRYDLVLANLLADTLIAEAPALVARVAPEGRLVASGILDHQADAVSAAFAPWQVSHVRADGPWRTLRFERPR